MAQNHSKKKKQPNGIRTSKLKKLEIQQNIDTLENNAMTYEPPNDLRAFNDLPLSEQTKRGLKKAFFLNMTDIQAASLPISLKARDVLGAARTGSGKTLAFLIPVLEILYRRRWGPADGLGALIISPTRELAVQIFEVLRSIGGYHTFSAGLVIGGKNLKDERIRLSRMNILVATPGRLLQHMDQTVGFETDNLQLLILDEADRILDLGFKKTLTALLDHLPKKSRQTLLFSATQTESVADLARLSLKDPAHIGLSSDPTTTTTNPLSTMPQNLEQHYLLCPLDQKLSILWSFLKTHLQSKTLVFLSSCKQVRFVFETFCRMHPGIPLLHLHGKQKQSARLTVYQRFTGTSHAVLFATDIASRGLDFPAVDWVVQLDAPEDAETYIHRVGRTARYESRGRALLFLMPSEEEGMMDALGKKGIEVVKIRNKQSKTQDIQNQLQSLAFQDPEIKYLGQRAFVSYLRSVYLHKDKNIFKIDQLPVNKFAESLGLPGTPKIKFLKQAISKKQQQQRQREDASSSAEKENGASSLFPDDDGSPSEDEDDDDDGSTKEQVSEVVVAVPKVRTKYDRMFQRKNQGVLSEHYSRLIEDDDEDANFSAEEGDEDEEEDFIKLKRANHDLDSPPLSSSQKNDTTSELSKRKLKLSRTKRAIASMTTAPTKLVFDDSGRAHGVYDTVDPEGWYKTKGGLEGALEAGRVYAEVEREKMRLVDERDRVDAREKKRDKKRKRKEKERLMQVSAGGRGVTLPRTELMDDDDDDDGYVSPEFDLSGEESEGQQQQRPRRTFKKLRVGLETDDGGEGEGDDEALALKLLGRGR